LPNPTSRYSLESIGFDLDYYNPATNRAGDMEFTDVDHTLSGYIHQICGGFWAAGLSRPKHPTSKEPQPTFVPLLQYQGPRPGDRRAVSLLPYA